MNRLRRIAHVAMVWTSVCLLLVDPTAACRLRNRRCCCECPAPTCDAAAPFASVEASPAVELTQPIPREPAGTSRAVGSDVADHLPPIPVTISPARPNEPRIVEPTIAPATPTAAGRQPANIQPPAAIEIAPPPIVTDNRPTDFPSLTRPSPLPATLQPRQLLDSTATTAPHAGGPDAASPAAADAVATDVPSAMKRSDDIPPLPKADSQLTNPTKQPAKLDSSTPTGPVVPPAFPPIADDPFAPQAPSVIAPKATEAHDDDPFAPLKPATPPQAKPAAPIAAEPTMKLVDPLLPGADGQLPSRHWSDDSGQFRVKARLLLILDGKVRLLKETGRTTTVPTERLSEDDRAYVEQVINRYGKELAKLGQLAAG